MRRLFLLRGLLSVLAATHFALPQPPAYNLTVKVDEIALTFHAADSRGLPVTNLKLEDLHLLDNGQPPGKILSFHLSQDRPVRAGILLDTSESMTGANSASRDLAIRYAQHIIEQPADQAFVMKFAFQSELAQPWTSNPAVLSTGLNRFVSVRGRPGTAVIDTIYRACLNQFGHITPPDNANFILLFSDGEDNASRGSLKDAVDICQHTNTAIYAIRTRGQATDATTLEALTQQTGGRILAADDSDTAIVAALKTIDAEVRTQYRLIYRPTNLKHDGSFHSINLTAPHNDATLTTRSGYYAPWR
jgi:Ca-activated chloride channel family protein